MSNVFSFQRFLMLLNKYNRDYLKANLLMMAAIIVLISVLLGLNARTNSGDIYTEIQLGIFSSFLMISGTIVTSRVFMEMGDKRKAIAALVLPVSSLERFLVAWVYSFILFPLVYTACFCLLDIMAIKIVNKIFDAHNQLIDPFAKSTPLFLVFTGYTLLHAFAFLGRIFFNKMHLIKTVLAAFVFTLFLLLVNMPIVDFVFKKQSAISMPFVNVNLFAGDYTKVQMAGSSDTITKANMEVILSDTGAEKVVKCMNFSLAFLLWAAAYFKLKEKQV